MHHLIAAVAQSRLKLLLGTGKNEISPKFTKAAPGRGGWRVSRTQGLGEIVGPICRPPRPQRLRHDARRFPSATIKRVNPFAFSAAARAANNFVPPFRCWPCRHTVPGSAAAFAARWWRRPSAPAACRGLRPPELPASRHGAESVKQALKSQRRGQNLFTIGRHTAVGHRTRAQSTTAGPGGGMPAGSFTLGSLRPVAGEADGETRAAGDQLHLPRRRYRSANAVHLGHRAPHSAPPDR